MASRVLACGKTAAYSDGSSLNWVTSFTWRSVGLGIPGCVVGPSDPEDTQTVERMLRPHGCNSVWRFGSNDDAGVIQHHSPYTGHGDLLEANDSSRGEVHDCRLTHAKASAPKRPRRR